MKIRTAILYLFKRAYFRVQYLLELTGLYKYINVYLYCLIIIIIRRFYMEKQAKIFKALAHPLRLKIIKKLSNGELCVCKLNEDVDFSQSNLSQHLRILKEADIVNSRKEGMWMYYSIANSKVLDIISMSEELY